MPTQDRRQLLTVQQLAHHLQVAVKTVYDWQYKRIGPRSVKVGKLLRYRWSDVEKWLDEQDD